MNCSFPIWFDIIAGAWLQTYLEQKYNALDRSAMDPLLELGLLHIIEYIKKFYKQDDANVCFIITLFQEPMVNGLNSGKNYYS